MTVKVAIHDVAFIAKPDKEPDFDWAHFNSSFTNVEVEPLDFINAIYCGRAYCPWMTGPRKVDNFLLAQHIAVDMDCGDERATLEVLQQHPLVQAYGAIIHQTPSHTDAAPRARVIFLLDQPITAAEGYKAAVQTVTSLFAGADLACVDAARFFFGNGKLGFYGDIDGIWFAPDPLLPVAEVRRLYQLRRQTQQQVAPKPGAAPKGESKGDIAKTVESVIGMARNGERNTLGFWLACTLRDEGLSRYDVESHMRRYQQAVANLGGDTYTEREAMQTVASAYRKAAA